MKIGIDLDNTITADKNSKEFFRIICHLLHPEYEIHIITNRTPGTEKEVSNELQALGINYNYLKITSDKVKYIREQGINILFENQNEYFQELKMEETLVFKIRESGNWEDGRWLGSKKTTKMID